ncbi:MAG: serine--tRNA ligase, partial [Sulfolobales archaeon]
MSWSILELLRSNPEILKENLKKRYIDTSIVDNAVQLDKKWREVLREVERLRHQHNLITSEIAKLKVKEEREKKIEEAKKLLLVLQEKEKELNKIE